MYYGPDLAFVHDRGYRDHAERCAAGVLALLEPVMIRSGLVVELGCGSGALTRHLVAAGHEVLATDASEAMLELARERVPEASVDRLQLPHDPIPDADAIVAVGHPLSYLDDDAQLREALVKAARALRPGGVLAVDVCDLEWGVHRSDAANHARIGDDWAIITEFDLPSPDRFVRLITTFVRQPDDTWRRADERHDNVLTDTTAIPALLSSEGVEASVQPAFGDETFPVGLVAIVGRKP